MAKLLDILLESIKESKPITLDKSVFSQIDKIYNKVIKVNKEHMIEYLKKRKVVPLGGIQFKNPYTNKIENIHIDLISNDHMSTLMDSEEEAGAVFDADDRSIYVNYNTIQRGYKDFVNAMYHELVHSIDPKIDNTNLYHKILAKQGKDASSEYIKYIKNPVEFDAFSSSFINQISNEMEKLDEKDLKDIKSILRKIINGLLSILKEYPNANIEEYNIKYFLAYRFILQNNEDINNLINKYSILDYESFNDFIINVIYFLNKPSLFKKYVQRLSTLL